MRVVLQWLFLFVTTFTTKTSSTPNKTPRLSPFDPFLEDKNTNFILSGDVEVLFYNQTLDHFNYKPESYATFPQRYFILSKWWGGAKKNAPIFVYLGAEQALDDMPSTVGFMYENAPSFKALLVYLEHRFYGKSNPVGSMEESVRNKNVRGYFNSAQALADYAEILVYLRKKLHAHHSPIIVIGGSYGGMLASWFRLKYPHITLGALASSAPILYFDDITPQDGYFSIVSKDFKEVSQNCYTTIKKSWRVIDKVASRPNGLAILTKRFKICSLLKSSSELKDYLKRMYAGAAQYNSPPTYPTTQICKGIDGASNTTDDILDRIIAGVSAYWPPSPCQNMTQTPSETSIGWGWQTCSEMVIPIGVTSNTSMFPSSPYNQQENNEYCKKLYDVAPRPHWATTYYGGHDIRMVLSKFGSNIIFSNGLRDPYSSGGVLEDISDSILAIKTTNGSHCLDILPSRKTDPEWLVKQRKDEVKIMRRWLGEYNRNLHILKQ
ncbi:lysosomal Pro-X carboxypeptidase [Tanacetum coccineum]